MGDLIRGDTAVGALSIALDGLSKRAQAITNNVANVDTPNFKASEVSFEQDLKAAISRPAETLQMAVTNPAHIGVNSRTSLAGVGPKTITQLGTTMRNDGNNVDIDREMALLGETQLSYQTATQLMNEKLREYKNAIWEGRK